MESDRFIVDSSVFVSFYYQDDANHSEAVRVMSELSKSSLC